MEIPWQRRTFGNTTVTVAIAWELKVTPAPLPYSEMLWVPIILSRAQRERRQSYMGLPRDQAVQRSGLGRGPALP